MKLLLFCKMLCVALALVLLATDDANADQVKLRASLQGPVTHPY